MQMIRFYVCSQGGDLSITFLFLFYYSDAHRSGPASSICVYSVGWTKLSVRFESTLIGRQVLSDFFSVLPDRTSVFHNRIVIRVRISRT